MHNRKLTKKSHLADDLSYIVNMHQWSEPQLSCFYMADDHTYPRPGSSLGPAHDPVFEVSDLFELNDWIEEEDSSSFSSPPLSAPTYINPPENLSYASGSSTFLEAAIINEGESGREKMKEVTEKVAFKTKSEVEVLDDGFKWRKYGKKMVKNSPNPRNYYRCSVEGCGVKKRVERDKEDPLYVVTTYEGIHNHQGPHQL